ncbi:hypothetical protein HDE_04475 [Halotydeus destructor]|nr:hypothetical protein HDE_04475 [Halotydeus destructor]
MPRIDVLELNGKYERAKSKGSDSMRRFFDEVRSRREFFESDYLHTLASAVNSGDQRLSSIAKDTVESVDILKGVEAEVSRMIFQMEKEEDKM